MQTSMRLQFQSLWVVVVVFPHWNSEATRLQPCVHVCFEEFFNLSQFQLLISHTAWPFSTVKSRNGLAKSKIFLSPDAGKHILSLFWRSRVTIAIKEERAWLPGYKTGAAFSVFVYWWEIKASSSVAEASKGNSCSHCSLNAQKGEKKTATQKDFQNLFSIVQFIF